MDNNVSRRGVLTAGGVLLAGLIMGLSACAQKDSLAEQARKGDNKNYVAGDGSVTEFAKADRAAPVALKGTLFNGETVKPEDLKGKVTVLNFWFAACAPCRVEAPQLEALHQDFKDQGVQFFGVNLRDEKATAEALRQDLQPHLPELQRQRRGRAPVCVRNRASGRGAHHIGPGQGGQSCLPRPRRN
ncbi:hypothetical protein StoSoilB13_21000 [Arthrobacter sp. StoSoilB13]|nr:hypothetical protein StoSoilB13_21000 [Arthrobacter sp. StoSoilB13]